MTNYGLHISVDRFFIYPFLNVITYNMRILFIISLFFGVDGTIFCQSKIKKKDQMQEKDKQEVPMGRQGVSTCPCMSIGFLMQCIFLLISSINNSKEADWPLHVAFFGIPFLSSCNTGFNKRALFMEILPSPNTWTYNMYWHHDLAIS